MLKKEDILNIAKTGLTLFAITAISALILAVVNSMTEPVIAENTAKKQAEAMMIVLPEAKEFSEENLMAAPNENALEVYEGRDEAQNSVGYAVMAQSNGYGGIISIAVGVDNDLKVTGIDIISQSETPGLGAKCSTDEFKSQFVGKTSEILVSKNATAENEIDAISSATITSKAVTKAINAAIEAVSEIKEGN